jgi:hypothetical protein
MLVSLKTLAKKAVCVRVDGGERESVEGAQGYFVCEQHSLIVFLQKPVTPHKIGSTNATFTSLLSDRSLRNFHNP